MTYRSNHRMLRARALANEVWREINGFIADECKREVCDRLMAVFMREGVEVLTDHNRQDLGLPPRGPDGWTEQEIFVFEQLRLDAMMNVVVPMSSSLKIGEPPKRS
ncbi:hypothetical protein [Mesorhizobium sp.]|uniref:hypothetical protein n=1 Tax=Mesorhizobium sp. TaxID=1871066 RepID=UPI001220E3CD|nr:hypothetical protein [Mesorhizobium sp.]TIL36189.1 MAG: hypothetical protein E5Y85_00755 [Mesorhizobium sp.]